jgi:hypothetical protein
MVTVEDRPPEVNTDVLTLYTPTCWGCGRRHPNKG